MTDHENLSGEIAGIFLISIILTFLISHVLLKRFKSSVLKSMNRESLVDWKDDYKEFPFSASVDIPLSSIDFTERFFFIKKSLKNLNIELLTGSILYSFVVSSAWILSSKNYSIYAFLYLFICFIWPLIISLIIVFPLNKKKYLVVYFLVLCILGSLTAIISENSTIYQTMSLWVISNGLLTIFVFALLNRRIRAIGPLVFIFVLTIVSGAYYFLDFIAKSDFFLRFFSWIGSILGLEAIQLLSVLILGGFLIFSPLGKYFLRWIGQSYKNKKVSEQSLSLNSLWIIFAVFHSFSLFIFDSAQYIFVPFIAFLLFKAGVLGFRNLKSKKVNEHLNPQILLFLRVFSLGKKSEKLYDLITTYWLRQGSICMISGPDLATSTLEPHEFYDYIGGKLSRFFINSKQELERRITGIDKLPDPDGRYRVNDFFCKADTWKQTVQKLLEICNVVLMDLRNFSKINNGCLFELEHLIKNVPFDQIILITDNSTDRKFLNSALASIKDELSAEKNIELDELKIFELNQLNKNEFENLLKKM